ncbi:MAG: hypothetical protein ACO1N9_02675 [Flavobacterium sp.]
MKLTNCKYLLLALLLLPYGVWANGVDGKFKKEKTIRKAYNVSGDILMDVKHEYGMITVTTWDQNRAEIDVLVRVTGNDEREVSRKFDNIGVDFKTTNSAIYARSSVGRGNSDNLTIEVNFIVKMPKSGRVRLQNEYGHIRLSEIDGPSTIICKYGQVNIDALNSNSNVVNIEYSGGCRIGYMNGGSIDISYSDITLANAVKAIVNSEYSNVKVKNVSDLKYNCSYGEINVGGAGIVTGKGDYSTSRFEIIKKLANITVDYGHVNIANVESTVKNIAITCSYTSVDLGYPADYPFDFEVYLKHNSMSGPGLKFTTSTEKDHNGYFKGYNKAGGVNKIFIKSEYAPVKFIRK